MSIKITVGKQSSDGLLNLKDSKSAKEILDEFNSAHLKNKYYGLYQKYKQKYVKLKKLRNNH